ncbi:MAG TPA: tetratricopeptide repeat protein [Vicinamibacterales bacterium]|nr:tetratricopeptide repeat protein [Vicinamibacterales bacterium]
MRVVAGFVLVVTLGSAPAAANEQSRRLRTQGAEQIFNLDRDAAADSFRQAIAADPQDVAAWRGLATTLWLSVTFRRGNMTVDDYLGGSAGKPGGTWPSPPPETVTAFRDAIDRALAISRQRLAQNPRDADAHFQVGAAVGLRASYSATVDGSVMGAFRAAREAYDEHETVLSLDPNRKDAGLIVGTYRYIVAALSLPARVVAYVVGFGGDKNKGLKLIEDAASYPGDNQEDARFALVLLYNREKRYDDALNQLSTLQTRYPRNRLLWLERGSTLLRAGRAADAERVLNDGMTRFVNDQRERMFGEPALWSYKRGAARAAIGRDADAQADLARALTQQGRKWVYGRARLELGKLAAKRGDTAAARSEFQQAVVLCEADNDEASAAEANTWIKRLSGR